MFIHKRFTVLIFLLVSSLPAYAEWTYNERIDDFTDEDRSSVNPDVSDYERDDTLVLSVSCQSDGLNVLLGHSYMGGDSDDQISVTMRVDKNEALGPIYFDLQGNEASWMPTRHVKNIVQQMINGESLVFRATDPLDNESLRQKVSLEGFSSEVRKLSCLNL